MTSGTAIRTASRSFRFVLFGLMYFVQGSALAYFRNFQKPYLAGFGIDVDLIGWFSSILLLPFILKIFIGMISDRFNLFGMGHRKPYMILGLLLAALSFGTAAFISPETSFLVFAIFVITGSFSVTLFDSTTDGLAIDTTPAKEQGTVQGIMTGGRAFGFIILSLVFGLLVPAVGYRVVFLIISASMLIPLIMVFQMREPDVRHETQQFDWKAFSALGKPRFLLFALYAAVYSFVSFGVDGLVTLFMVEDFNALDMVGNYGALRGVGAVIGALVAGLLFDRLGRQFSSYGAAALIMLGAAVIGLAGSVNMLLALGLIWGIAWGFQETIFVALAMKIADSRIAASMFALMMAVSNIGTAIGENIATGLTDNISFSSIFWLLAGINIFVFPIVWGLFKIAPELSQATVEEPIAA